VNVIRRHVASPAVPVPSLAVIVAAAAGVLLASAWAGSAEAALSGQNGKLVFASSKDGDEEIYSIGPDGSGLSQLTDNAVIDVAPRWSPDGQKIAFASNRDGDYEIYVMGADGSNPTRLTSVAGNDWDPAWSPDGKRIAFTSYRDNSGGTSEIYVMGADGSDPTRLTTNTAFDDAPAWSPGGRQIAFQSNRAPYGPDAEIYVMGADGSNPTHLTTNASADHAPAWSPDGQKIAFASNRDGGILDFGIYVMGADGSNPTPLTPNQGYGHQPTWSPDGQRIAFTGVRADGQKVRIINPDDSRETTLTSGPIAGHESGADWQSLPGVQPPAPAPADTQPAPTPTSTTPSLGFAGVRLVSTRLSLGGRFIALRLSCPAGTVGRCSGRTRLTERQRRTSLRRVTLGRARFSIAPGSRARVKVRVTRAGRRLLRNTPRVRGRAVSVASDGAGRSKTTVARVTIRRRHR
jgi:Tol biopolymer transport system component